MCDSQHAFKARLSFVENSRTAQSFRERNPKEEKYGWMLLLSKNKQHGQFY